MIEMQESIRSSETGLEQEVLIPGPEQHPNPTSSSTRRMHITLWYLEVAAASCSLICIAGVIAVLKKIENQPYQHW